MIFKTFQNNDIDKWASKIGIFGKSFYELGEAINSAFKSSIDNIDDFDKDIGFWGSLKDNLFPKKEDLEKLKVNVPDIFKKDQLSSVTDEIKEMSSAVANGDISWQKLFDTLPPGKKHLVELGQQLEGQIITEEKVAEANRKAYDTAIAYNNGLKQMTLGAKASKIALEGLKMVGNMFLSWAIIKIITVAIEKISDLATASKKASEAAQGFSDSIRSAFSDISSNTTTLSKLTDEYNKLSEGYSKICQNKGTSYLLGSPHFFVSNPLSTKGFWVKSAF